MDKERDRSIRLIFHRYDPVILDWVKKGFVSDRQLVDNNCQYIPVREWQEIETELKSDGFL